MSKKAIFDFKLNREIDKPVSEESVNDKGEKITITKSVKTKVPVWFSLKQPNRAIKDDAELYYKVFFNRAISKGLLPWGAIHKLVSNENGVFSKDEKTSLIEYGEKIQANLKEKEVLHKDLTDENLKKSNKLDDENLELYNKTLEIRQKELTLYSNSAENHANNETLKFYVVSCAYWKEEENQEYKPFFSGAEYEDKIKSLRVIDDEDDDVKLKAIALFFKSAELYFKEGLKSEQLTEIFKLEE